MKKLLSGIIISTFCAALAHAQETCQLPSSIPKASLQRVDCKNGSTPDYYTLALSWSPQYCSTPQGRANKFQCRDNQFDFVVHGLWAQENEGRGKCGHPRNCGKSLVDKATIRETVLSLAFTSSKGNGKNMAPARRSRLRVRTSARFASYGANSPNPTFANSRTRKAIR
jgi:ribonuclease I